MIIYSTLEIMSISQKSFLGYSAEGANYDNSVKEYLKSLSTKAILVRPDKYVLGSANTLEELNNLLSFKFIRNLI